MPPFRETELAWYAQINRVLERIATALEVISDRKTLEAYPAGATKPAVTEPVVTDPIAPFDPWAPQPKPPVGIDVTDEVRASNPFDQHVFVPDRNRCDICGHSPSHPRHVQRLRKPTEPAKDELPHYGHIKMHVAGIIGGPWTSAMMIFDGLNYVNYDSDAGFAVRNVLTEMLLGLERRVRTGK